MKGISTELEFETRIRDIIRSEVIPKHPELLMIENQKTTDILICKNGEQPGLYFLEIKYHKRNHGRLGFGHAKGKGFQPEVLRTRPHYFEQNMRWIIGADDLETYIFTDNKTIIDYVSGGEIDYKHNNIQTKIFKEIKIKNVLYPALQCARITINDKNSIS